MTITIKDLKKAFNIEDGDQRQEAIEALQARIDQGEEKIDVANNVFYAPMVGLLGNLTKVENGKKVLEGRGKDLYEFLLKNAGEDRRIFYALFTQRRLYLGSFNSEAAGLERFLGIGRQGEENADSDLTAAQQLILTEGAASIYLRKMDFSIIGEICKRLKDSNNQAADHDLKILKTCLEKGGPEVLEKCLSALRGFGNIKNLKGPFFTGIGGVNESSLVEILRDKVQEYLQKNQRNIKPPFTESGLKKDLEGLEGLCDGSRRDRESAIQSREKEKKDKEETEELRIQIARRSGAFYQEEETKEEERKSDIDKNDQLRRPSASPTKSTTEKQKGRGGRRG